MKRLLILNYIYLIISLYGCSVDNTNALHDTTTDEVAANGLVLKASQGMYATINDMALYYDETMTCMGMTAVAPTVAYVSYQDYFNGAYGAPWGGYLSPGVIFVNTDNLGLGFDRDLRTDMETLKHEYIHHILDMNGAEWRHPNNGEMFAKCGLGVNTYN